MQNNNHVEIQKAKGRPMLQWVGKRPIDQVTAYPAQLVESFEPKNQTNEGLMDEIWQDWPEKFPQGGLLFHGDNKDVLAYLLASGFRGKVDLIYIDPPFDSGADYIRRIKLKGKQNQYQLAGINNSLGEQIQYEDIWGNDNYLQFIYERILLLKELLSESGSIWILLDYHRNHYIKIILDEVFSESGFISEVIWKRSTPRGNVKYGLSVAHDNLLVYSSAIEPIWNQQLTNYTEEYKSRFTNIDESGRRYVLDSLISPNPNRPNLDYEWNGVRKVWRVTRERMKEYESAGRLEYTSNGVARYKRYFDELQGAPLTTIWTDIFPVNSQANEDTYYPTQKPESLLERILQIGTNINSIVLDCFIGSGTTAAVAQIMGRRWIGCDINKGAIQTTAKRLQKIINEQKDQNPSLPGVSPDDHPTPCQSSFYTYQVNDYDLQIQHNEAVQLACEHMGITRTRTDAFFDGVLGKKLVKIIPFNHPVSPLDLEEIKNELGNRPEEDRDIVVAALGKELAVEEWLEDWNRMRRQGNLPNKIEIVELRSDPKYGGFFTHHPAQAKVRIQREGETAKIRVEDFISPSILQRLQDQSGVLAPSIEDWRSMVDSVMIDTDYDGNLLNVVLADVPEKKDNLVAGEYELPIRKEKTKIAVKITDMLGEEALIVEEV